PTGLQSRRLPEPPDSTRRPAPAANTRPRQRSRCSAVHAYAERAGGTSRNPVRISDDVMPTEPTTAPATPVQTARGRLHTYIGSAPGVGKTYAMLNEGARRAAAGEAVMVGWIETHDRAATTDQLRDLRIAPTRTINYRGRGFEEMDPEAIV